MARPRKDSVDTHKLILKLAQSGMTNKAIAEVTGITERTIYNYLSSTDLGDAVKAVRQAAATLDAKTKEQISKSAIRGMKRLLKPRKTKEVERRMDADGNVILTIEKEKQLEPHAGMIEFALKNLDAKTWNAAETGADSAENETDTDITINIVDETNGLQHDD